MGGVHVYEDQAGFVLGKDVDAVELGEGVAEGWGEVAGGEGSVRGLRTVANGAGRNAG